MGRHPEECRAALSRIVERRDPGPARAVPHRAALPDLRWPATQAGKSCRCWWRTRASGTWWTCPWVGRPTSSHRFRCAPGSQRPGLDPEIAGPILKEVVDRLRFLCDVGLDYLTLGRGAASLSGGETQRIRLATQIGSAAGRRALHPRRAEHRPAPARQRATARHAEGPSRPRQHRDRGGARRGHDPRGRSCHRPRARGPVASAARWWPRARSTEILEHPTSLTARYLRSELRIKVPAGRRARDAGSRASRCRCPRQQPEEPDRGVSAGDVRGGDRRVGLGQVDAGHRHSLSVAGTPLLPRAGHSRASTRASTACTCSTRSSTSTRVRSGARRAATRPPTPVSSRRSASCSPACPRRSCGATDPGVSPST